MATTQPLFTPVDSSHLGRPSLIARYASLPELRHAIGTLDEVAADLGNTPTVCRASYVHPLMLEAFPTGALHESWSTTPPRKARLTLEERRTRAFLGTRRRRAARPAALREAG